MAKVKKQVEDCITPIVEGFGLELVEVAFEKKHDGMNLTIYIDKKGGVTLEDCETVHRAIDEPLDELNPTNDKPYTLNVSSPGIDRPIVTDKDFKRNVGEVLEVKLYEAIQKKKLFVGTLVDFNSDTITLELENNNLEIERKKISKATKYINF